MKNILFKLFWILIALGLGYKMFEEGVQSDVFANESQLDIVGYSIRQIIFICIGIGLIGVGLTRSLLLTKEMLKAEKK